MNEHSLYGPIVTGANADGMKLFRIHDGGGANAFDIGGVCGCGLGVGCEVKVSHKMPGSPIEWAKFQNQQITWLKEYTAVGALAIVPIYYTPARQMRIIILEHAADYMTGWRPPQDQFLDMAQLNGKYRGIRYLCPRCHPREMLDSHHPMHSV